MRPRPRQPRGRALRHGLLGRPQLPRCRGPLDPAAWPRLSDPIRAAFCSRFGPRRHARSGPHWRTQRVMQLLREEPWRALLGRLMMTPPTRALGPEEARTICATSAHPGRPGLSGKQSSPTVFHSPGPFPRLPHCPRKADTRRCDRPPVPTCVTSDLLKAPRDDSDRRRHRRPNRRHRPRQPLRRPRRLAASGSVVGEEQAISRRSARVTGRFSRMRARPCSSPSKAPSPSAPATMACRKATRPRRKTAGPTSA